MFVHRNTSDFYLSYLNPVCGSIILKISVCKVRFLTQNLYFERKTNRFVIQVYVSSDTQITKEVLRISFNPVTIS